MRSKSKGKQFDESSESNFTTTKSLYLIKSTDNMIKPFRRQKEGGIKVAFSFNGAPGMNFTQTKNILGDGGGVNVKMTIRAKVDKTSSCPRHEGNGALKTLPPGGSCIYKALVYVLESLLGGGGGK